MSLQKAVKPLLGIPRGQDFEAFLMEGGGDEIQVFGIVIDGQKLDGARLAYLRL